MIMTVYSIFRFVFEILCIVIAGYWGFSKVKYGNWRIVLGILAPLIIVVIWSVWGAPASLHRLQGIASLALELGIYAVSAIYLYNTKFKAFVICFILLAITNACINFFISH
ncbi:MAG: YrdB family protein [Lachnospiraceae bacterium]